MSAARSAAPRYPTMLALAATALLAGFGTHAKAQDLYTSPLDHTGVMALGSAADAQAEQVARQDRSKRRTTARQPSTRRACSVIPSFRARFGASDPRIVRLARLCRRAGYR
ncbi:hypothetical protein KCP91_02715 [Microvirga sp. SRT01]|uniref:UrcA family protein n=1 Tax=Sphingomonas longa TaxID=2778730 RepID=A0ABS2D3X4_9SPHN|nr:MULTISPECIES: hypothetical protein [Alphaproteobacteria]MBM6575268.1 hypothetical protein [Sphingomonas sp. BT552]MBR7708318.1 hypothetical protein [Microvirga sp. SRT01]